MNKISEILRSHYSEKYLKYGATSEGVDWGSDPTLAKIRQEKMLGIIKGKDRTSLLDVGCGYGHMAEIILEKQLPISYCGIDVVDEMINSARKIYPEFTFYNGDYLVENSKRYDYLICNGVLTQKLTASILDMNVFAQELIAKMYAFADKGVAFNIMNTHVNFQRDNLYYRNPVELIGWCTSELTPHLVLDSAYKLWYEYTVYLYKPDFIKSHKCPDI